MKSVPVTTTQALGSMGKIYSYGDVVAFVQSTKEILIRKGIRFNQGSALGKIFRDAEKLSADWDKGITNQSFRRLINAAYAHRIAMAIADLAEEPGIEETLQRIASGNMNLSSRSSCQGKDALWELSLMTFLRSQGIKVRFMDPPDLMADFGFGEYPIACKKVYSNRGVEAQLRKGCKQLEPFANGGLVAVNIDDLVPEDVLLRTDNSHTAGIHMRKFNSDFIEKHTHLFERFVGEGRCDGVLICSVTVTDLVKEDTRLNNFRQIDLWTLSDGCPEARARMYMLGQRLSK